MREEMPGLLLGVEVGVERRLGGSNGLAFTCFASSDRVIAPETG